MDERSHRGMVTKMSKSLRTPRRRRPRQDSRERMKRAFLRRTFPGLARISVTLAARWAELLFRTPPRSARLPCEKRILDRGERRVFRSQRKKVVAWFWGESPRTVLLVHGWGGHAGRLSRFVGPLLDAGFSVMAIDAPAHGDSDGRQTGLPDVASAILAAEEFAGPLAGVIGHSMGAAAAVLAVRDGLRVERVVLLAPPTNPEEFSARFARSLCIPPAVREKMKHRLTERHGWQWARLRLLACVPDHPVPLLIFHDARDAKVPLRDGEAILTAWQGAAIVRTRGLGHHRIARSPDVISSAVRFLSAGVRRPEALPVGA